MAHTGKWRKLCGLGKSNDCYNCANRQKLMATKDKISIICDIGYGQRELSFSRHITPHCGAWRENTKK